jgi:acetoin utilization protein AcuA
LTGDKGKAQPAYEPQSVTIDTPKGLVTIYVKCPPGFFCNLKLDSGLGSFAHYSSIIRKLEALEQVASQPDGRVVLAIGDRDAVVGYAACWYPEAGDRWSKLNKLMYEMGAIEVSRNYRRLRIAETIVQSLLKDELFEKKIAYLNGYCWHWDLEGTGLTMFQYRQMMLNFLKKFGFQEYYTNEPNIALRQENVFMARVGSKVSEYDRMRFRNLRFGIVNRQ